MAEMVEFATTPDGGQVPPRSLGSEVWNYFTIVTFGDEHKTRCSICKHDLSYTPGITGTSAMRQHLINKHDIPLTSKARNSHANDTDIPMDDMSLDELIPDGRKGKKSKVWNFFKLIEYGDERYSRCVMCRADLKYHGSTTSMLHHLRAKHYTAFTKGEPPQYSLKAVLEGGDADTSNAGDMDSSIGNDDLNLSPKKPVSVDSVNRQHRGNTGMGRGKSSVVWRFFKVVYFGADKRTRCDLCGSDMAYHDGTTAMHKHLERKHPREYAQGDRMPTVGHGDRYVPSASGSMENMYDDDDVDDEFLVSPANVDAVLSFMEQTDTSKAPSTGRELRSQENKKPLKVSVNKETIKSLLKESITNLCRERLQFDLEVSVEALIGVTVDKKEVLLVNINETLVPDEYTSSARGQKRGSQTPTSSAKKKTKRGRGRPPKHSPWSRKDTDVSLQMETFDAVDEDWEPGGAPSGKKSNRESTGRTRRARKRVSYREKIANDSDDDMNNDDDHGNYDDADQDYTPEKQVEVKLERLDWNPPTMEQDEESDNKFNDSADQEIYKSEGTNRVDMSVKSCVICNKIFVATEHLNHHMVVHHGLGLDKGESQGNTNDVPNQGDPSAGAQDVKQNAEITQQQQQQHQQQPDTEPPVKCKYCGETLQVDQAVEHFYTAHPGQKIEYIGSEENT